MKDDCAHVVRNAMVQLKAVVETGKTYCKIGRYSAISSWMIPQIERLISELDSVFSNCPGGCCEDVTGCCEKKV